jgi:hypothetical protein
MTKGFLNFDKRTNALFRYPWIRFGPNCARRASALSWTPSKSMTQPLGLLVIRAGRAAVNQRRDRLFAAKAVVRML